MNLKYRFLRFKLISKNLKKITKICTVKLNCGKKKYIYTFVSGYDCGYCGIGYSACYGQGRHCYYCWIVGSADSSTERDSGGYDDDDVVDAVAEASCRLYCFHVDSDFDLAVVVVDIPFRINKRC